MPEEKKMQGVLHFTIYKVLEPIIVPEDKDMPGSFQFTVNKIFDSITASEKKNMLESLLVTPPPPSALLSPGKTSFGRALLPAC